MRYNRKRTLTTLVGVILSAILVYAVFGGGYSIYYNQAYDDYKRSMGWDAEFVCDGETAKEILALPDSGDGGNDLSVKNAWAMQYVMNGIEVLPWAYVSDFSAMPEQFHLTSGVLPKNENEMIISQTRSAYRDLPVGSFEIAHIYYPDPDDPTKEKSVEIQKNVSGIFRNDFKFSLPGQVGNDPEDGALALMPEEIYENFDIHVFVRFDSFHDLEKKVRKLAEAYDIQEYTISEPALTCSMDIRNDAPMQGGILFLGFLIECITLFIIRNAFNISIQERNHDYGILRCIGMSRRQIIYIIINEAFWIALVGGILGVFFGHILTEGIFSIVKQLVYVSVTLEMHFYWRSLFMTVLMVFLGTAYAMVAPIEKLYRMNPVAAMNKQNSIRINNKKKNGGKRIEKVFRFEVQYAYQTIRRSRGRFLSAIVTLAIGTAIFVGVNSSFYMWCSPYMSTARDKSTRELTITDMFYKDGRKTRKTLEDMKEVKAATLYCDDWLHIPGRKTDGITEVYIGVEQKLYDAAKKEKGVTRERHGVTPVQVKPEELPGLLPSIPRGSLTVPSQCYCFIYSLDENQQRINIDIGDLENVEEDVQPRIFSNNFKIAAELDLSKNLNRFDKYCIANSLFFEGDEDVAYVQEVKGKQMIINCVLVLLLIVFITNLTNIQSSQMMLRKTELEILRVLGMTKKQLSRMLYAESIMLAVNAWFFGCILGIIGSLGWYFFYRLSGYDFRFQIRIGSMILIGIILLISSILTVLVAREDE